MHLLLIVKVVAMVGLIAWLLRQFRKPSGWLGRGIARSMNVSHGQMTDWGLQQVAVARDAAILDVGCGGGETVRKLAEMAPAGSVVGVDLSAASVAVARKTNAAQVAAGRVRIEEGSVAALPFVDASFDVVTAVETHYYWPDLPANVREIRRVLKPGGSFALIAEAYRGGPLGLLYAVVMPLLGGKLLSDKEHRDLLVQAGFVDVATHHQKGTNWICAVGKREP
ncbi:UbiE/COQ5 methyltransferase [Candidatus Koribacter versatilis Ellin345]|uniref:UbiE/COQ5 methyltransferase n=1 Tax=Koribacter versatilis (strain Ellin345) TaxID=204669 RepID=Q1ISN3_KORVE|nr:class I SAM-dependent methyltransferase [Candidatus Koribacter versatilis]ABF40117.1 UbiE/COQ5 methyltransferase [Candidatus Koribacter versatilis Ellin345]